MGSELERTRRYEMVDFPPGTRMVIAQRGELDQMLRAGTIRAVGRFQPLPDGMTGIPALYVGKNYRPFYQRHSIALAVTGGVLALLSGLAVLALAVGLGPFPCTLEVTQEYVDVSSFTSESRPDLAWEFVDEAGHYHAWTKDETLPTLDCHVQHSTCGDSGNRQTDLDEMDECGGEDHMISVCKLCTEPVEPAYVTEAPRSKVVPGRSFWEATIYGVHLKVATQVSLSFSEPATGRVHYFGIGNVDSIGAYAHEGEPTPVTKVYSDGPLARKGK